MSERVETVRLTAQVSNYVAGMKQAAAYSTYVGTEAERAAQRLRDQRAAFEQIGRAALAVGAIAAAGVVSEVAKFAEFDQVMSNVNAVTASRRAFTTT